MGNRDSKFLTEAGLVCYEYVTHDRCCTEGKDQNNVLY